MEKRGKEYLEIICTIYSIAVLGILPLFMREGYWQIGDAKYFFYRNISIVCFCLTVLVGVIIAIPNISKRKLPVLSSIDIFMLAYGVFNLISFLKSEYPTTAWQGYEQWYMGTFSQLLFIFSYFIISRVYKNDKISIKCGQIALFIVALLGILNRLAIDPLRLFTEWTHGDWEYTHMLSTIGNANWLCGYLSVSIPFVLIGYLVADKRGQKIFLFVASILSFVLLCIQGSDSGLAIGVMCLIILGYMSLQQKDFYVRILKFLIGICVAFPIMRCFIDIMNSWGTFPANGWEKVLLKWWGFIPLAIILLIIYKFTKNKKFMLPIINTKRIAIIASVLSVLVIIGGIAWLTLGFELDNSWASGRGGLWKLAVKSFWEGDLFQKIFGVGPDCYGLHIYSHLPVSNYFVQQGHWENAFFTNAHNEWLNQLVNTGIFGVISYGGIFASSLLRFGKRSNKDSFYYVGIMAILLYGLNSLVSFQQVLNAPILFLLLGMCESRARNIN